MGIFDNVRNSALKAKLHTEIALLDRQIVQQKSVFGVELYNKMTAQQQTGNKIPGINVAIPVPSSLFPTNADAIRGPLEDCRKDVQIKQNERDACEIELEKIVCHRERANPNQNAMTKAGSWVSDTSKEAQLKVRSKLLEREIYQRKEKFGVDIFDLVVENAVELKKKGNALTAGIGKWTGTSSSAEKDIQECIQTASRQVAVTRQQKESKLREIAAIDEGAR